MSLGLHCYLMFNGNAREAMEFYQTVFGGELTINTMGENASADVPVADADRDKVMHAQLDGAGGITIMASDTATGMTFSEGSRITLSLNGDNDDVLRHFWQSLATDGTVTVPLMAAPWGDTFGMLTDKFGINWMIDIAPSTN